MTVFVLLFAGILVCLAAAWLGSGIIRLIAFAMTKKWRKSEPVFWGGFAGALIPGWFEILPAVPAGLIVGSLIGFAMSPVMDLSAKNDAPRDNTSE